MKKFLVAGVLSGVLGGGLASTAVAADVIKIDGSGTVYPITEAMAEEFQAAEKGKTRVTVSVSGTGGGFKKLCSGLIEISDASRPIKEKEKKMCAENGVEFIELPVALDAITVAINSKNNWVNYLTVDELKKMWEPAAQGKISSWKQIRSSFPDKKLQLFGKPTVSGTYDYFVEAVIGGKSTRGDYSPNENDNILVTGVANNTNALAFFGLAYYEANKSKLKAVPISWQGKKAVSPSVENAKNGTYQPLSRPIFIYVNKKAAQTKPYVKRFVDFYLNTKSSQAIVADVGYVPLPNKAYELAQKKFKTLRAGTVFNGPEVGVGIEELLSR